MSIQYTTRVEGKRLFVVASGFDESLADVESYGMGVISASLQGGVTHVFCDETALEYRLGTFDIFQAAEFISTHAPLLAKIAILCDKRFINDASFFEDIAVNRGLALRVFTDKESAFCWLYRDDVLSDSGS